MASAALSTLLVAMAFLFAYKVWAGIFNCYWHPLAKFRGPKLAAMTGWYQTWHVVFLSRNWYDILVDLHGKYGDIVRIGPNELHFSRSSVYTEIYSNTNRWDKEARLYRSFGEPTASFSLLTYAEAKQRKNMLQPLFSRNAIVTLESLISTKIDRLCDILAANDMAGQPSDVFFGFRCFTLDTIMAYCFGKDMNSMAAPNFQAPALQAITACLPSFVVFRHFEIVRHFVLYMPGWLIRFMTPELAGLVDLQEVLHEQVKKVTTNPSSLQKAAHSTIYHRLLDPSLNKHSKMLSEKNLFDESQAMVLAGSDTVANALMFGILHVLRDASVHNKLKEELKTTWSSLSDPIPRIQDLEKLPYLTAVVKEALRITPNVPSSLLRIVPAGGVIISGESIPAGTIVGMSAMFVQFAPDVFDHPHKFAPERWLYPNSTNLWTIAFSRGPRSCLGQNLALCELYIAFAALLRRFDFQIDGTNEEDPKWRDCFVPFFTDRSIHAFCKPVEE